MVLPVALIDVLGFGVLLSSVLAVSVLVRRGLTGIGRCSVLSVVTGLAAVVTLLLKAGAVLQFAIPDSAEYVGMASRLLHDDTFFLRLDGRDLPSRYQPWFSWFLLYPLMKLSHTTWILAFLPPLCAILGAYAAAMLAVAILPPDRRSLAPTIGAGVVLVPAYLYFSGHLITDIPATAITLLLAAVYCAGPAHAIPLVRLGCVGVLGALVFSMRPLGILALLPFLVESRRGVGRLAVLLVPTAIVAAASLWLNQEIFGDPFRSGYNLWVAVPYDYLGRTFSLEYVSANLEVLVKDPVFLAFSVVGLFPLSTKTRDRLRLDTHESRVLVFVGLALVPQMIVHLVYFYSTIRFFLALEVVCGILVACRVASIVPKRVFAIGALCLVLVVGLVKSPAAISSMRHSALERIGKLRGCAPVNALVVSARHSVLNEEFVVRASDRTLVPVSRHTELASKVLVWSRVEAPHGVDIDPRDHRASWLLQAGVEEVYPHVAVERPELLSDAIANGITVVLDREGISTEDLQALERNFSIEPFCAEFEKLSVRLE
jgi:hypothetical protein